MLSSAMGRTDTQAANNRVITWGGNSPEWNRILHLGGVRMGCSDAPTSCAASAEKMAKSQDVGKVFLAILLNPGRTPIDARQYSELSRTRPELYEVGFDDFVSQCERQKLDAGALSALLNETVRQLKSANPNLLFGITLYDDEISSTRFPLKQLDEGFRQSVDLIHLYPHYRKEAQAFPESVQQARDIFPHAKIVAGVYAYDRRDYLPCARGNPTPCTNEEEKSLFAQSLHDRLALLGHSDVDWLEFYPGSFGMEASWKNWHEPRICRPERLQECIENTKAMHEMVQTALNP